MTVDTTKPEGADGAPVSPAAPGEGATPVTHEHVKALETQIASLTGLVTEQSNTVRTLTDQLRARQPANGEEELTAEENAELDRMEKVGDPASKAAKLALRRNTELAQVLLLREELSEYPKAQRQAIYEHFQGNRNRFASVTAAAEDLESKETKSTADKLKDENERLKAELRRHAERGAKVDPNVIRTEVRESPAGDEKKSVTRMTFAEYDRQQAQMKNEGRAFERMAQQAAYNRGDIELVD